MASTKQTEYLLTESDIRQLLGKVVPDRFIKDYASMKGNTAGLANDIDRIDGEIDVINGQILDIDGRLIIVEGQIIAIDIRLTTAEGEIVTLRSDLDIHIAADSAHGATGDIVGTDDYATAVLGGTVFLAAAVSDASASTVTPPAAVGSAGAVYAQAYAQGQTDAINALSAALSQTVTDLNALTTQFNALLASERTAKQLAP